MLFLNRNTFLGNVVATSRSEACCISKVRYDKNTFQRTHCHENPHFSLVVSGGNFEKRPRASFERLPGEVTFYQAGEPHCNIYEAAGSSHINLEILPAYLESNSLNTDQFCNRWPADLGAGMLILKMYTESIHSDVFSCDTIHLLLLQLLGSEHNIILKRPSWIDVVHQLLNDRWNETPGLVDLANAAGVHPVTISKHFARYFGCTLGEYMRKLKVARALTIMKTTNASLTEIAYECGFADQSHFIRTFKHFTGFIPGAYQRL